MDRSTRWFLTRNLTLRLARDAYVLGACVVLSVAGWLDRHPLSLRFK